MKQIKSLLVAVALTMVVVLGARATIFPHVEVDGQTISIPPLTGYQLCYEPNSGDRKIVVDLDSVTGQSLEVGIVTASLIEDSMDDPETFARAAIPGSYMPSLVSGTTEGTTQSNLGDKWCLLAVNRSGRDVTAEITVRVYFRL